MDESAKLRMNLVAIQRVDPYAKEILDSCPHVAYYKFVSKEWQKSEIEGSFFIYSRVAEPFHSIFINNRLNTNSLVEPITKPIELQSQPPFLLYRNQRSAISGFWFYCKEDCVRIFEFLESLLKRCNNMSGSQQQQQQQQQPEYNNPISNGGSSNGNKKDVDIFSMLSKAQAEFNCSGLVGPSGSIEQKFAEIKINNAVQTHQPLMKQLSSTMPDITSPNVVNFFAAAQQPNGGVVTVEGHHQSPMIQTQQHPAPKFMGNSIPPVQTVDEIEKQHRVSSISPKLLNNLVQQQQSNSPQPINLLQPAGVSKPTLITPTMFQASNIEDKAILGIQQSNSNASSSRPPEPLTQNQLMQALNYLLENDPEFIRKIHEAYVKSFNKIITL